MTLDAVFDEVGEFTSGALAPEDLGGEVRIPPPVRLPEDLQERIAAAAMRDRTTRELWNEEGEPRWLWTTLGGRGAADIGRIAQQLADSAVRTAWWRGDLSPERMHQELRAGLTKVRDLVAGRPTVAVTEVFGLTSHLKGEWAIETDVGSLRQVNDRDRMLFEGGPGEGPRCDSILEVPVEHSWRLGVRPPSDDWPSGFPKRLKGALDTPESQLVRFAVLLASNANPPTAPSVVWASAAGGVQVIGGGGSTILSGGLVRLQPDSLEGIREWVTCLSSLVVEPLRLPISRVMSATGYRLPADSLLDCVVAWETLFGERTESTFRISMAIGQLLGDSLETRLGLLRTVKRIYGKRSDLVHGRTPLPRRELQAVRDEALALTVRVMRAVLERPDLIPLDNSERVQALLLG